MGISGTSLEKREQFNQMLEDAKNNHFDIIITKEVSRFARNTVDTLSCVRSLKNIGIGVIFMNDNIDTLNNDGELRLTIISSIAQEESRKISERVKWGQKRSMEQGIVFGRDLLGYTINNGKLYINPNEASIVKLIFQKFLIDGKSTHAIAKELNIMNIRPKRVKEWSNTTILRVLKNEKYVGDLCQKKTFTPNYLTHKKKYNHNNEDMIYIKNHHEPIIDRFTWNNTQIELAKRSPINDKIKYSNRYWCSGRLICGECTKHFIGRTKILKDSTKYKSWRCFNNANYGSKKPLGCDNQSVNDKVLISSIEYILNLIGITQKDIISTLINDIDNLKSSKIDTSALLLQIEILKNKKNILIDTMLDGVITKDELSTQKQYYDNKIFDIQSKINQIESTPNNNDIKNYLINLDFKSFYEDIFQEILDKIFIYKGNILEIFLKNIPLTFRLKYSTHGRLKNYTINFEVISIKKIDS